MDPRSLWLVCVAAGASAIGWLFYFRYKDRARPEPLWMTAVALVAGGFAVLLALLGYEGLSGAGLALEWDLLSGPSVLRAGGGALLIGAIEELAKLLAVVLVVGRSRHFDEPLDGLIYAGCAGTGFSVAETVYLAVAGGLEGPMLWARVIAAPATHALFSSLWGAGLAAQRFQRRPLAFAGFTLAAIAAHGGYDLLLARPELPSALASLVVLAVWTWFLWATPRLARAEIAPASTGS